MMFLLFNSDKNEFSFDANRVFIVIFLKTLLKIFLTHVLYLEALNKLDLFGKENRNL